MIIIDSNLLLRYLLKDDKTQNKKISEIVESNEILITNEVMIKVCKILEKTYHVEREIIYTLFLEMMSLDNIVFQNRSLLYETFKTFMKENFDIVDCMLIAYKRCQGVEVATLDKKLEKYLKNV